MFGLFKKNSEREILLKQYSQLQEEAFHLSKTNRTASDAKTAEAEALMQRIESLPKEV
ncbi:MAG: Lacal_2735 family protein [Saprospiraceae bacterium]|nr:Lacal_2735 family protein [Saprospiraceae bacterium]MBK9566928.1 Lacal_2735 family protein [Saprospiraceae bacterium]MBP6447063.1 Lacal_2735 family protein [Saprospiraceae bacterium]